VTPTVTPLPPSSRDGEQSHPAEAVENAQTSQGNVTRMAGALALQG